MATPGARKSVFAFHVLQTLLYHSTHHNFKGNANKVPTESASVDFKKLGKRFDRIAEPARSPWTAKRHDKPDKLERKVD